MFVNLLGGYSQKIAVSFLPHFVAGHRAETEKKSEQGITRSGSIVTASP